MPKKIVIECKGLDEITAPLDVCEALGSKFADTVFPISSIIIKRRRAYSSTQMAEIKVPDNIASKNLRKRVVFFDDKLHPFTRIHAAPSNTA